MNPTRHQRDLVALMVEAWTENVYEAWEQAGEDERENELVDAEEMFEDHGPGAVYLLRCTDEDPAGMDAGNWGAVERAVYGTVMGDDEGYAVAYDVPMEVLQEACASLGLTRDYFTGQGRGAVTSS